METHTLQRYTDSDCTADQSSCLPAQPTSSAAVPTQSTPLLRNHRLDHDCGCADIYDHTGKKRQQACDLHKLNPTRSVLPLPPKKPPPSKATAKSNEAGGTQRQRRRRRVSVYTPLAERKEQEPPPRATPTKGRKFVKGSENGPAFLDPFNSERAMEPTGPPGTLTTIPTQEERCFEVYAAPRVAGPEALDPSALGSGTPF